MINLLHCRSRRKFKVCLESRSRTTTLHFYLLIFFSFCLPFNTRINSLLVILLVLNGLLSRQIIKNFSSFLRPLPLLFSSLYLLHLIGLLSSENMQEALQDIETKLSLLIFPLLLFTMPIDSKTKRNLILHTFILGCFVASLYCMLMATNIYFTKGQNAFFYKMLSGHLGLNPAYFSLYLGFCIYIVVTQFVKNKEEYSLSKKILTFLLVGYFLLFVLLLSSRMILLSLLFLLSMSFLIFMYKQKKLIKGFGSLVLALIIIGGLAWNLPITKKRIQVTINSIVYPSAKKSKPNIRLRIWKAATEVIKSKPILGHGTGDIQDSLVKMYKEKNYTVALEKNLNAHNQYLQIAIGFGILGLIILLANLFIPFFLAAQGEQYIYLFFLALFIMGMMTEAMLELQQGVMFYAFFNSFLVQAIYNKL